MKKIACTILTPERNLFDGEIAFAVVDAHNGEMGFLVDHAPLISELGVGEVRLSDGKSTEYFVVEGGIVEIRTNKMIILAEKASKLGATDIEIAYMLSVDVRTLYRWKSTNDEFCQALKVGKEMADKRVERSLFARAVGYEHDEVDIRAVGGEIVQTQIRKYSPPDPTAGIFWLKNRNPE